MPTKPGRPCLVCHTVTRHGPRCPTHCLHCPQHRKDPATWQRLRHNIINAWINTHGLTCPGAPDINHPPHPTTHLTLDHITPRHKGGTDHPTNLRPLCPQANHERTRTQ